MPRFTQPSLSGGELSPGLQGRIDLARYATSLKTCRNVITKPTGGAAKRPGFMFRGQVKYSDRATRIIPFIYSTTINYLIEMGDAYLRFWVDGVLLRDGSNNIVEVATPYIGSMIYDVRFTQSADVLYMVHPSVAPKELRRTDATTFVIVDFAFKRGPFRQPNTNDAYLMVASATTGVVAVSTNVDVFTSAMIGSLIYMEEKELRGIKPWVSGEKNPPVGTIRRSDEKVYKLVSIPSSLGGKGTPFYQTGGTRPVHDTGRAFDGPQDIKDDGVNSYATGVEWEFLHNTFGILRIQAVTDARNATAVVIERLPDSVAGTLPTPGNTWSFTGNGSQTVFNITGATALSEASYTVSIAGSPAQSNPGYGDPDLPYCVDWNSVLPDGRLVRSLRVGDLVECVDIATGERTYKPLLAMTFGYEDCCRVSTAHGSVVQSNSTPMDMKDGRVVKTPDLDGEQVLTHRDGFEVASVMPMGRRAVCKPDFGNCMFFAGERSDSTIATHNILYKP
ncbi:hypothetical protein [Pseudoxanthomonas sp. JBR18]|uniref:hypothetical protein n=1 Tax=Pseudoxanthomonas sp. JBR18 TaxID=2969308 RepID=UPI002306773D|nr:hypothetical protein [Pseudoxanthomonas sp. JBR18]WCE04426.1 hypothetical protein PJ250_20570 [Pseudoxanthomonas sp. JBR18]